MSPACDGDLAVLVEELVDRDDAFGLVADVDDHFRRRDLEDRALDDLAFRDVPEAVIVDVEQPGELSGVDRIVVVSRACFERAAIGAVATTGALARRHRGAAAGLERECSRLLRSPCLTRPPVSIDCRSFG